MKPIYNNTGLMAEIVLIARVKTVYTLYDTRYGCCTGLGWGSGCGWACGSPATRCQPP